MKPYIEPELVPERLISIREALNLTKSQASRAIGMTPIGYIRYEQGLRKPSLQMMKVIAARFQTSVDYLTGVTDDPTPDIIYVSRNDEEMLFRLISELQSRDEKTQQKVYDYYKKNCSA